MLVLLIVLSLSTVWTVQAQSSDETASVSITLAIDTSDSMWGNPINNVREAATDFVLMSDPSIPIAVVTFSNQAQVVSDFTTDRSALLEIISELTPGGVTALYDGATVAMRQALQSDASQNYVVLLSDGAEYGGQSDATREDVLALANSSDLSIVTIGLGFGADRTFLEAVSSATQTAHYDVGEITDIKNVFVEISTAINLQLDSDVANNQLSADYIQISDNSGSTVSNTNTEEAPVDSVATGTTAIVLTVDVSQSMTGTPMNNAIEALRDYVADLNADIPVAIVTFSNRAEVVQDFTTDKVVLTDAINNIAPIGVTALYDGAYESVQLAASSGADNPIVILLSDGGEYGGQSNATPDLPITLAQQTGVSIKAIGVGFGFDRTYLERLTTPNNGELFVESEQQSLNAIYAQLSQEVNAITVVDAETD
ncbi:MAG: VWA domain-containing protein, partial [Chloroflexota bacterium]